MRSHSWVSPKCVVLPSPLGGRGVFAAAPFQPGELICVWGGAVITATELADRRGRQPGYDDRCIAVHDGFWLAPISDSAGDDAERFNHSCEPNAGIRGQVLLVARRAVAAGEEVTFDYETAETDLPPFRCACGSTACRERIDGSASRDRAFLDRHTGYLSWYLEQSLDAGRPAAPRGGTPS